MSDDARSERVISTRRTPSRRHELAFLDGLRGVAALVVVLYHAYLFTGYTGDAHQNLPILKYIIGWGYLGVPLFIVLSGFVLMIPLAQNAGYQFPRGVRNYLSRRARRILPPYWGALTVSLLLITFVPVMQEPSGTQWDTKLPVDWADIISHIFLVHDFSPEWIGSINGPLWSVAIEWHIYFLMPFVLIPLWRRFHPFLVIFATLCVFVAVPVSVSAATFAHPWLVACFAFGMLAADCSMGRRFRRREWFVLMIAMAVVLTITMLLDPSGMRATATWITEVVVGAASAAGIAFLSLQAGTSGLPRWLHFLESRALLFLGLVSYSIYLLHSPLLGLGNLLLLPLGLSTASQYAAMNAVVVPCALALCCVFFTLVERHFQNTRQRHSLKELSKEVESASP